VKPACKIAGHVDSGSGFWRARGWNVEGPVSGEEGGVINDEERAGRGEHGGFGGRTVKLSMIYGRFKVMRQIGYSKPLGFLQM